MKKLSFGIVLMCVMVFAGAGFSQTRDIDMKLLRASADGQLETVKSLVRSGANVNASQSEGATPLIVASFYGADDVVEFLIRKGANVNAKDARGNTALMQAAYFGFTSTVKLLVNNGANVLYRNSAGLTAGEAAKERGYGEISTYLGLMGLQQFNKGAGKSGGQN